MHFIYMCIELEYISIIFLSYIKTIFMWICNINLEQNWKMIRIFGFEISVFASMATSIKYLLLNWCLIYCVQIINIYSLGKKLASKEFSI